MPRQHPACSNHKRAKPSFLPPRIDQTQQIAAVKSDYDWHFPLRARHHTGKADIDRKSTRLNSSHGYISYAVFCLKKKKNTNTNMRAFEIANTRPGNELGAMLPAVPCMR